jgi:hypothetical protein
MHWAKLLAQVFYRLPKVAYGIGIKSPSATTKIGKILCGEMRYADVAGNAIKKLSGGMISGM